MLKTIRNLISMTLPSSKLNKDISIIYNHCDDLKPLDISELSLTTPMKKKVLNLREKNKHITITRKNKKLTLIIPYRNREEHLKIFLPTIEKILQEQSIDYEIIIAEQDDTNFFNKAKLMNIAALHADKASDYFVFHDVDSIPHNVNYKYCNHTVRLFNYIKRDSEYEEYPQTVFGGAILIPKNIFFEINGFANNYWQWGKEDDDFLLRHLFKGYIPLYETTAKLSMLPHPRALTVDVHGNIANNKKILQENKKLSDKNKQTFSKFKRDITTQENDGINTLENYTITSITTKDRVKTIKIKFIMESLKH
ncbi:galactosyltransferase-related protein [Sulfurimonas sp.]